MQFPITRYQLVAAVETYGFRTDEAERIIADLEGEPRVGPPAVAEAVDLREEVP